ncbi:hypothetical protein CPB86DRAFT_877827 [Serendipita vermifera]|nr:hypothetical protein CPB86DRAFT_877827 [Serendipita vermifera]
MLEMPSHQVRRQSWHNLLSTTAVVQLHRGSMRPLMTFSQFVDLSSPLRPTNAERLAVLDQIASLEPRLEDIKHRKNLALAHLSSLLLEKSLLETEIMRRKELLHPIKSLSPHILTRIFEFDIEARPKGIARLQLVSKEWRHLVRNSPSLWTSLHVVGPFHESTVNSWKRYIDVCFLRSKKLPLKVCFLFEGTSRDRGDDVRAQSLAAHNLLNYLTLFVSSRWISLEFTWLHSSNSWGPSLPFDKLCEIVRQAPGIQSIHVRNGHHLALMCMCTSCAHHAITYPSSLQSLHIYDVSWDQIGPQVPVPSVEELSIEWNASTSWNDLVKREVPWLSLFPSLLRLTLYAANTLASLDIPSAFHSIPYAASDLHTLKIVGPVPAYVLHNVRLPALDTLRIHENVDGEHILEKDRCISWFKIFCEFGANVTSQVVCLGPDT